MMPAAVRLALLLALLAGIALARTVRADTGTPVALAAGALLLCGLFAGKVAKRLGLPRLTGYLLIGLVIGPYVLRFLPREGVSGLELVKGLAVSLIALAAGVELRLSLIRRVGGKVLVLGLAVVGCVFLVCGVALFALRAFVPFLAQMPLGQAGAVAALVSAVIVSFSPTVTIAIVQETRAKGPFTEFLMAMVILGDLFVMILFAVAAGLVRATLGAELSVAGLLGGVGWELFGSVLAGTLLAVPVLVYLRKGTRDLPIFISAVCFVAAEGSAALHLSPLLVSLAAGAVIANLDERGGARLHDSVQRAGLPVFALFFAAAGAGLHLDALASVGLLAVLLVALRGVSIYLSCRAFAPRDEGRVRELLWMGLISQAGVTFGLAALVGRTFPTFGPQIEVLIVAMVTLHELVGPVLSRRALVKAGEVDPDAAAKNV